LSLWLLKKPLGHAERRYFLCKNTRFFYILYHILYKLSNISGKVASPDTIIPYFYIKINKKMPNLRRKEQKKTKNTCENA